MISGLRTGFKFALVAMLLWLTDCRTPVLMAPHDSPLEGRNYQVIGETSGESCIRSILGIPFSTDASLKTTLEEAKKKLKADALIEVVVDQSNLFTGFYNETCTLVVAKGVRFIVENAQTPNPSQTVSKPQTSIPTDSPSGDAPSMTNPLAPQTAPESVAKPVTTESPKEARARALEEKKTKQLAALEEKRQAEEKRKQAILEKRLEEQKRKEEERNRKEEAKKRKEEEKRLVLEKKKAEEETQRKVEEEKRRAKEEAIRKEQEEKRLAELKRQAEEEAKPIPAQFQVFCKFGPGEKIRIETKSQLVEANFVKCVYFGVRVQEKGQEPGVIPFEQIWNVTNAELPMPGQTTPTQSDSTPQQTSPQQPTQPLQPAKPQ